jgi:hypothetical protein
MITRHIKQLGHDHDRYAPVRGYRFHDEMIKGARREAEPMG